MLYRKGQRAELQEKFLVIEKQSQYNIAVYYCYTYDEKFPIEGSSCCLKWEKYSYPDVGSKAMRGSVQEDSKIWVCAEHWTAPHHNGYVEGWLKESNLLLIDLSDGEILFGLIKIPAENAVIYYRIKVAWTSFEPVGNEHWEFLVTFRAKFL